MLLHPQRSSTEQYQREQFISLHHHLLLFFVLALLSFYMQIKFRRADLLQSSRSSQDGVPETNSQAEVFVVFTEKLLSKWYEPMGGHLGRVRLIVACRGN